MKSPAQFVLASPHGYLTEVGWSPFARDAVRLNEFQAVSATLALPGSYDLRVEESTYEPENLCTMPEFCGNGAPEAA